jgi:hypothetical protein
MTLPPSFRHCTARMCSFDLRDRSHTVRMVLPAGGGVVTEGLSYMIAVPELAIFKPPTWLQHSGYTNVDTANTYCAA